VQNLGYYKKTIDAITKKIIWVIGSMEISADFRTFKNRGILIQDTPVLF
jgi:hypothetical protein